MAKRKEKPTIKVDIKRFRHPNAERVEIVLTDANAALRKSTMMAILAILEAEIGAFIP